MIGMTKMTQTRVIRSEGQTCFDQITAKRQSKRTKAVVPVRPWVAGSKDSHLAHTLDLSNRGVRLGGCRAEMKVGDMIEIQYRQKNAQFRIAWITAGVGSERQIGR